MTHDPAIHMGTGRTMIEQFGWEMIDSEGSFELLDKRLLNVDPSYHRDQTLSACRDMAREWCWMACGALVVALRPDGSYFVVDGGHRWCGAMLRADITELPCMVFRVNDIKDEARGFYLCNNNRKPVQPIQKFRALLKMGDPATTEVNDLLREAGYRVVIVVSPGPKEVKCVRALTDRYSANPEVFKRVWPLILQIADGGPLVEIVVQTLPTIEAYIAKQGLSLLKQPWRDRLLKLKQGGIVEAANRLAEYYGKGEYMIWSKGVVDVLNKGVSHKMKFPDPSRVTEE